MATKLTKKQKEFVETYAETGNGTKAALATYDTEDPNTAAAIASENLRKPNIMAALEEALPDSMLLEVHREGLFATRSVFDKEGSVVAEDADFNVRAKYLDMGYKLKGSYAPEKRITATINVEPTERIKDLAKKLNQ